MANRAYVVTGDLPADDTSESHSTKILCDQCVTSYKVVAEDGPMDAPCDNCGASYVDEDQQ